VDSNEAVFLDECYSARKISGRICAEQSAALVGGTIGAIPRSATTLNRAHRVLFRVVVMGGL
jgi:hypothetical protein